MKAMAIFCSTLMLTVLIGCAAIEENTGVKYHFDYPPELDTVNSLISERKTQDAKLKVDDYLNKSENIHWFGHAYFLKAFLYEMDEDYDNAIKYYRSAIQHSSKYNSRVEAKALYNLSFVFERTESMDKLTTSLLDLMKRREFFDSLTGQVEIPARLAAVYASLGKKKEAYIFHREAATNFDEMVRKNSFRAPKSEISKSLYYLGFAVFEREKDQFKDFIDKVGLGQKYMLASIEASNSEWAEKAKKKLNHNYDRAWDMITQYKEPDFKHDKLAEKKQTQMKQLVMAADLYDLMYRLRAEEFPMSNVNQRSKETMDNAIAWIDKIESFAQGLDLGPEMIRNKPVKQRKLLRHIEKKEEPVRVNKETAKATELPDKQKEVNKSEKSEELPPKTTDDPNL